MTTTIIYPDAGTGGATVDGHVKRSGVDESFSAIRTGAGVANSATTANENCAQLTATATSNQYSVLRRSIITADSSAVPSGDTVTTFTVSLYGTGKNNELGNPDLDVVTATPASNNALVNDDYTYTNFGTTALGSVAYGSFSKSGYNDISCDVSGVTKAGITKIGLRLSWDTDNSAPTWTTGTPVSSFQIYFADQAGTTNDPKLTIVHAPAGGARRVFLVT